MTNLRDSMGKDVRCLPSESQMQVWLHDVSNDRFVSAELAVLTRIHVTRAQATWIPDFKLRLHDGFHDQDQLLWDLNARGNDTRVLQRNEDGYVIQKDEDVEGIMILQRRPRRARSRELGDVLYVAYLATAPWNRCGLTDSGKHRKVGLLLLAKAAEQSLIAGCEGCLGLHSLPGSNDFYRHLQFHDFGPDPGHRDLNYFESENLTALSLMTTHAPFRRFVS